MLDEILKTMGDPNVQLSVQECLTNPALKQSLTDFFVNASESLLRIYGMLFDGSFLKATGINLEEYGTSLTQMLTDPDNIRKMAEESAQAVIEELKSQENLEVTQNVCKKFKLMR